MSAKKIAKTKTTKAPKAKKAKRPEEKKLSAIDAAAQVLAIAKEPMNAKELIEAMKAKALWTSPGGKTPHATLVSAIIRQIAVKEKESRFVKPGGASSPPSRAHKRHVVAREARKRASFSWGRGARSGRPCDGANGCEAP